MLENERTGEMSAPFTDADQRLAYREAVERDLDADQIDRLRDGDVDMLKEQITDRLDRLYAAKVYLQSNEATANILFVRLPLAIHRRLRAAGAEYYLEPASQTEEGDGVGVRARLVCSPSTAPESVDAFLGTCAAVDTVAA